MAYDHILFNVAQGVATLTFNRPKVLNALNSELLAEFAHALDALRSDEAVRVLVLTGAGERAFVAGADINELATLNALGAKHFAQQGHAVIARLQELPLPVIAGVNGFALGGGMEIALACDFIYAAEEARFGLPEISLGLIPGFGGTQRLARLIGRNQAKELIFTGKMIDAAQALDLGIVNRVFAGPELMPGVMKAAAGIAAKGRVSIRAAKQVINSGMNVDLDTGCRMEVDAFALCMASEDAREGTAAFLEKRKAEFRGLLNG